MGYSGLKGSGCSDGSSDIMISMRKHLWEDLKMDYKGSEDRGPYNIPSCVDVCLVIESGIFDTVLFCPDMFNGNKPDKNKVFLLQVKKDMIDYIKKYKENFNTPGNEENFKYHLNSYRRMLRSLKENIDRMNQE